MKQRSKDQQLHDKICLAIGQKHLIEFTYQRLRRIAEPHDYGEMNGSEQLLVYQVEGESRSGRLPDWRLIRVSQMSRLQVLDRAFPGNRTVPSGKHKQWERLFIRV
ncbi:hypothetical protein W02_40940 [Nitrospira sp. KM1]|uniref:hypothetical protein n=1 Tax=Nitrospira sp. KM1 TaxID=1936990 RepID=UPI0013A70F7D|nr:hypothetical protein [Nitrospira sp. KM1]BCA56954.1 hypothetical protein W02_40940 [Nitrospira sp. KM1]